MATKMNGTGETDSSLEKFTIANIFQSIQQKLKNPKSDENELQTKSPAGILEQDIAENESGQKHNEIDRCEAIAVLSQSVPGSRTPSDDIVIKKEKNDAGYELYSRHEAETDIELVKVEEPLESDAVVFHGVTYRDPDNPDDESDSDTSSLSGYGGVQVEEPEHDRNVQVAPRSKGEVLPEELPPMENLHISLPEETRLELLGVVSGIVGVLVVIESTVDLTCYSPLNDDTVLFYENRQPFGVVFEVFGPCKAPYYSVRFNSADDIEEKGIDLGHKVYFVPDPVPEVGEITHFVFVQKLKTNKGSDASWKGNNEPPEELVDYSDDEEEKRIKAKRKAERGQQRVTGLNKSVTNEEKIGGKEPASKKKHIASAHGSAPSKSTTHVRPDSGDWNRYKDSQQSSSVGRERGQSTSRRDFFLSEPVLARASNPVINFPQQPSPWGPRGSQTFLPRSRVQEKSWARGSPRNGPYGGTPDKPAGAGGRDSSSEKPKSGSFIGGTGRPFLDSSNDRHSIWRPHQAYCMFPVNTSAPPPNFSTLSDGQGNSQQEHPSPPLPPPPPPPQWTSSSQPLSNGSQPFSFSHNLGCFGTPQPAYGTGPRQPGLSTGPSQPGFGYGPSGSSFGTAPQQWRFGAVSQPPPRFQGQPQFLRYHQGQN